MGEARVGVVVITHNRCAELDRTLGKLIELPEAPAVVVVDNGSEDATAEMVRTRYPQVTLLTPGMNLGATGRNLGVALVDAPYVAFCDDDTWWEPGSLTRAADLLDRHPQLAVLTAHILVEPDGRDDPICEELCRSPLHRPAGLPGYPLLSFLAGASILRRSAFEAVGGFSARLWLGGEEELLASDLATAGWSMAYVPELLCHHHPSVARDPHLRRRHGIRNTLWFTWLRRPWRSALRRTVFLARTVPRDMLSFKGFLDALRGLPWVLVQRRVVPAEVEQGYLLLEEMQRSSTARQYVS
ncbi:MAG: glycosyltransferase [Actinomycetota bacterium]|nr:glycosyltransferase [Actinomycetota bacterium]